MQVLYVSFESSVNTRYFVSLVQAMFSLKILTGRTNRLLSFDMTRTAKKTKIMRQDTGTQTENDPIGPQNEKRTHKYTQQHPQEFLGRTRLLLFFDTRWTAKSSKILGRTNRNSDTRRTKWSHKHRVKNYCCDKQIARGTHKPNKLGWKLRRQTQTNSKAMS
jgi:hypothetical protein